LAAQKNIRLLCYCSAVGHTEEEYPVPVTALASSDEKNRKYSKASERNFLEPN
jgi:hypothetical protein